MWLEKISILVMYKKKILWPRTNPFVPVVLSMERWVFLFHWQGRVYGALCMTRCIFKVNVVCIDDFSAANKYYSSASHHEQKTKKATG